MSSNKTYVYDPLYGDRLIHRYEKKKDGRVLRTLLWLEEDAQRQAVMFVGDERLSIVPRGHTQNFIISKAIHPTKEMWVRASTRDLQNNFPSFF